jgi:hypothetical protein
MRKMTCLVILFLIMMIILSGRAQSLPPSPSGQAVTVEEVHQFLDEFRARYMKMDLEAFMALFSKEAVENRMLPYEDIRDAYERVFATCDSIQYNPEIYAVQAYQESAFVSGRYELIHFPKGKNKRKVSRGNVQWDLIREDGFLKIREMNYGRDYPE